MPMIPRRDIVRSMLAGLFPWHHAGLATSPEGPAAPIAAPDLEEAARALGLPWDFQVGAVRWRFAAGPGTGGPQMTLIPRWEWEELADHPQPMPIATRVVRQPARVLESGPCPGVDGLVSIFHDWADADAPAHCTRCRSCYTWPHDERGVTMCQINLPIGSDVADADAPTYSQRDEGGAR